MPDSTVRYASVSHRWTLAVIGVLTLLATFGTAPRAEAVERICDVAHEDCRAPLLDLINNETVGIDVAFWFMEDTRYASALINRWNAGVPVRVLMDSEANTDYPGNVVSLQMLRDAGIPMRNKSGGDGILHWKMMLFVGQNTVEYSGANYSDEAFVPLTPYSNYVDEVISFTDKPGYVNSFKTRYDDNWTNTTEFSNYANVTGSLVRKYATYPIDPEMNFVPWQNFADRSVSAYNGENLAAHPNAKIDAIMYRITDQRHSDAMIAAAQRGVPVRLISEPLQYRDATRLWHAWNIDRMYMAGLQTAASGGINLLQIRHRKHDGLSHEKLTLLYGQHMTIFGSSNWTSASAERQTEHNIFTTSDAWFTFTQDHFNRKWNNLAPGGIQETEPFVPLGPDQPSPKSPANNVQNVGTSVTLSWWGGPWAHKYDVYIGTDQNNMTRILTDRELGPSVDGSDWKSWAVSSLAPGTTYFWKVVGRTMANKEVASEVWNFRTAGGPVPPPAPLPTGWNSTDIGAVGATGSASFSNGTYTVQGSGSDIWGSADALRYAYTTLNGDGSIVARVSGVSGGAAWVKVGVMIRGDLSAGSAQGTMLVSASKGLAFQRRTTAGGATTSTTGAAASAPYWVKIARAGNTITASQSANGSTWTVVGTDTIALPSTAFVGLAVSSHDNSSLATGTFDSVVVTSGGTPPPPPPPPPPGPLPTGWSTADVGSVGVAGSASYNSGTYSVQGSGADIWGTADAFRFVYSTLNGDGAIVARVAGLNGSDVWTKGGVMIRGALTAGAAHASMLVTTANGLAFQRRTTAGGDTTHTSGASAAAPYWVKIARSGNVITASQSINGTTWSVVGTDTIVMPATVYVGLAVTNHDNSSVGTGTFDSVLIDNAGTANPPPPPPPPPPTLPSGWSFSDVGAVGAAGSASASNGTFTVKGAGADVWGTADAFGFAATTLTGNGQIVARVASVQNVSSWTKAGVMVRDGLTAGAAHGFMIVTPGTTKGTAFQRRLSAGGASTNTTGPVVAPPYWVKIVRSGSTITASTSPNGTTWTVVATDTITMGSTINVGLAVSSHVTGTTATATFDNVSVTALP